jgi:prolipoprotein diacylglyceryltransferase
MEQIALIYHGGIIHSSYLIISLAVTAAICGFLCLYLRTSHTPIAGFVAAPLALALSLALSRLVHWYAYAESYESLWHALTNYSAGSFILLGAFPGCMLAAELTRRIGLHKDTAEMLDCMCLAGGASIAVGRLSAFFNASFRGEIADTLRSLPWVCPVVNAVSGVVEYRFATFLLQAMVTALITAALFIYRSKQHEPCKNGDIALLFLLCYCATQIVADSIRYDAIYFHSNGFISITQVCCALTVVFIIILLSVRTVKKNGLRVWNLLIWSAMLPLLGIAGYMEYHVQRHGDQRIFAYTVMSVCLAAVVAMTIYIYHKEKTT